VRSLLDEPSVIGALEYLPAKLPVPPGISLAAAST
jgi:hypothetical protein